MNKTQKMSSIEKLHPFENHPYKVQDNEEMGLLAESIRQNGLLAPILVRPLENTTDEYEIISGHRRIMASQKAGITEVPAVVVSLDRIYSGGGIVLSYYRGAGGAVGGNGE